jgi:histidinol phosphatase-like enzyme
MINEEYILTHQTFNKYKQLLQSELKQRHIEIDNIDDLTRAGIRLVLSVDRNKSKKALEYIAHYANVDLETMFKIFIAKEVSQIIYQINDVDDSVSDLFGWVTLAIMMSVRL